MRAAAEIDEVSLLVDGHVVLIKVVDDLDLVRLVAGGEELARFLAPHLASSELLLVFGDPPHLRLDLLEVFGS